MIKKENRLKKNRQFTYVYKKGQSIHSSNMYLVFAKTKYQPFKIGFSVSNKVGKAVVRNKVKRRLREIVKAIFNDISNANNYVLVAKNSIINLTYIEMKNEVIHLFKKGNLLK